jgi:hypothetical protein
MSQSLRRGIREAEKSGATVETSDAIEAVLDLSKKTFARQKISSIHLVNSVRRVHAKISLEGRCRSFVTRDESGVPLGGVWIAWDSRRAYYLLGGYDETTDTKNAVSFALWSAIKFAAETEKLPEFDFEGSMLPAVERFFRKFGGQITPTYTVSWRRPTGLLERVSNRARRMVSWRHER